MPYALQGVKGFVDNDALVLGSSAELVRRSTPKDNELSDKQHEDLKYEINVLSDCLVGVTCLENFNILLTVHLSIFIYYINQLDALNFIISLFQASTCFEHHVLIVRRANCIIQSLVSSH